MTKDEWQTFKDKTQVLLDSVGDVDIERMFKATVHLNYKPVTGEQTEILGEGFVMWPDQVK